MVVTGPVGNPESYPVQKEVPSPLGLSLSTTSIVKSGGGRILDYILNRHQGKGCSPGQACVYRITCIFVFIYSICLIMQWCQCYWESPFKSIIHISTVQCKSRLLQLSTIWRTELFNYVVVICCDCWLLRWWYCLCSWYLRTSLGTLYLGLTKNITMPRRHRQGRDYAL